MAQTAMLFLRVIGKSGAVMALGAFVYNINRIVKCFSQTKIERPKGLVLVENGVVWWR